MVTDSFLDTSVAFRISLKMFSFVSVFALCLSSSVKTTKQTDRQMNEQTNRQTHGQTDRKKDMFYV